MEGNNQFIEQPESNRKVGSRCPLCEIMNDSERQPTLAKVPDDVGLQSFETENKENYAPPKRRQRRENKENIY